METDFLQLIQISVELELNLSKLYRMFHLLLPQDSELWWQLSIEEMNHASLIRTGERLPENHFPADLLCKDVGALDATIREIQDILIKYQNESLSRETAFELALQFEEEGEDIHFQLAMTTESSDEWIEKFKDLNRSDMDHKKRIKEYMESNKEIRNLQ